MLADGDRPGPCHHEVTHEHEGRCILLGQMSGREHSFGGKLGQALIWGVIVITSVKDVCTYPIKLY